MDETQPAAILIYGGGGHAKAVIDLLRLLGTYRLAGLIDDNLPAGEAVLGVPVVGGVALLADCYRRGIRLAVNAVGGIGKPEVRVQVFERMAAAGFTFPAIVHPKAFVESSATLAEGVQVFAMAYVGSDSHVGFGSVLNNGAILSHDCILGECVNLSPGATLAGGVKIDDHAQLGMRATVNLGLHVGAGARVGNGATVKQDVPAGGMVYAGTIWPPRT